MDKLQSITNRYKYQICVILLMPCFLSAKVSGNEPRERAASEDWEQVLSNIDNINEVITDLDKQHCGDYAKYSSYIHAVKKSMQKVWSTSGNQDPSSSCYVKIKIDTSGKLREMWLAEQKCDDQERAALLRQNFKAVKPPPNQCIKDLLHKRWIQLGKENGLLKN